MNDDQIILASAYLDGELTADERATAEADPAVMAEVEVLRALRGDIAAVEPPSAQAQDAAVAAAMAAFTETARAPAPTPQRVVWDRPVYRRVLAMAAAVVAVGVLGVVIVNTGADDQLDSGEDTAEISADDAVDDAAGAFVESAPTDGDQLVSTEESADFDDESGDESADDAATSELAPATHAADMAEGDDAADSGGDASAGDEAMAAEEARPVDEVFARLEEFFAEPDRPLLDDVDVAAYGLYLVELQGAGELPPTPNTVCVYPDADADVVILGQTLYTSPDGDRTVLVAVQAESGQAFAIDAESCDVVVDGTPVSGVLP